MLTTTSPHRSSPLRAAAVLVALTVATPVVHAAPGAPRTSSANRRATAARAAQLRDTLDKAQREREQELARVQPLVDNGQDEKAAHRLVTAALTYNDPVLHIEAAERFLAAADRRHLDALTRARESLEAARDLLAKTGDPAADRSIDPRTARVAHASIADLLERCDAVEGRLARRTAELRLQRRGRQEITAGASLLFVGLTGVGVLAGGVAYRAARKRELAGIAGHESEYDLGDLDAQGRRADAMIGVGAVVTVVGAALGVSLMAIGARDLRGRDIGGKETSRQARLQVAPTLGGLVLSGRF